MGVDFMAESVRATLDSNGLKHVPVYRLAEQKIGCSLAEAAERQAYAAFLHQAAQTEKSLHVVYINTSLVTKARAQETVRGWSVAASFSMYTTPTMLILAHAFIHMMTQIPTITCTSSNVLQTVLQAFAQVLSFLPPFLPSDSH